MKTCSNLTLALPVVFAMLSGMPAMADDRDAGDGKREFTEKCASCHGLDGKGQGAVAPFLKAAPADLTTLTKKNGGVFPYLHVEAVIDGRDVIKVHGNRDMPVWGSVYLREGDRAKAYFAGSLRDMEAYARLRVLALMDHVHRIQEK